MLRSAIRGFGAHMKGIRFAFGHPSYLPLVLIPFFLTLILFSVCFYLFTDNANSILAYFWDPANPETGMFWTALHWLYTYIFKYILYLTLLLVMYFLFMVVANIIASPVYDIIAQRISKIDPYAAARSGIAEEEAGILKTIIEECKKAVFVLIVPLVFLLIPLVGPVLSVVFAMLMLGWDFFDFSLSRDKPTLKGRLGYIRKNFFLMLAFGSLLFIPFVHFILYPFAILGASVAYQDEVVREKLQK